MFKLIAFVALLSVAAARPSLVGPTLISGPLVHTIPSAISHQSTVQIHGSPLVASVVPLGVSSHLVHPHLVNSHLVNSHLLGHHQILV